MMSENISELKNIIEAALLAAGEPLTIDRIISMFPADSQPSREAVGEALTTLARDYEGRGIELKRVDRSYRFQTCEKYAPWIVRLQQERPPRYSRALLETLAIIAYKQPVTRGDIEAIRGVSVSPEIIRTLLEREWIRQVGYRDTPGKPALFGTTRQFPEYFNLSSLDELPPLAELRDLETIGRQLDLRIGADGPSQPRTSVGVVEGQSVAPAGSDAVVPVPQDPTSSAPSSAQKESVTSTMSDAPHAQPPYPKREEA